MNKEGYEKIIFIGILSIIILWLIISSKEDNNFPKRTEDSFSDISELHWDHMPISYKFINKEECDKIRYRNILESFKILNDITNGTIEFVETSEEPDLKISCIDRDKVLKELGQKKICKNISFNYSKDSIFYSEESNLSENEIFISGKRLSVSENETIYEICYADITRINFTFNKKRMAEGGPSEIEGKVIKRALANFFKEEETGITCSFPSIELHEILHSFNFGHSYEPLWDPYYGYGDGWFYLKDIMFPQSYCELQKEVQEKYVSCLKYIYSNGKFKGNCSGINFLGEELNFCENGWYRVKNTKYCCPESDMIINEEGYCDYV